MHPKVVPQMRDAAEVMAGIERRPGTVYAALIPNEKGAMRAIEAGVDKLHTVLSASESHNLANVNMTVAESLDKLAAVAPVARDAGIPVQGGISTVFGCPFEGRIPLKNWIHCGAAGRSGLQGISLADTTGMANPAQVQRILEYLMPKFPGIEWNLHTHNTRGMAIPNILAAMSCGVQSFDSSVAGLGGCPFAPARPATSAPKTWCTACTPWTWRRGSISTSWSPRRSGLEAVIAGPLPGQVMKAGPWDRRYALPHAVEERLAAL